MKKQIVPVVLCGGSGSRLWPLSRKDNPKQFLKLFSENTLFQQTIDRINLFKEKDIQITKTLIIASEEHRYLLFDQLNQTKITNTRILLEPSAQNTAPALTMAAFEASEEQADPILIVMPSDHRIENEEIFANKIHNAIELANQGRIVIFGILPTRIETGFGYIQRGKDVDKFGASEVSRFIEKPSQEDVKSYIAHGDFFWNSGVFVLRASVWLNAIKFFRPDIYDSSMKAFKSKSSDDLFVQFNKDLFEIIPSVSIDYAVMQECHNSDFEIKMIDLDVGWNDLGNWDALWNAENRDDNNNVISGDVLTEDTKNSFLLSSRRLIVVSGLRDVVVVETADAIFIADRKNVHNVKDIVEKINGLKREEAVIQRKVFRPWGWYDCLESGENFKVKRIQINPGASISLQKHNYRAEHWVVVKGVAEVTIGENIFSLKENESTFIPIGQKHRLANKEKNILEIIEVQSGNYLGEDDIVRFEDIYNRH